MIETTTPTPAGNGRLLPNWSLNKQYLPILLTILTFVGLAGGWWAERQGWGTSELLFYTLGFAAGGYEGLKAGLASLRQRQIDVDLLMILAAAGAVLVGAPFEGVLLLFLFSLSNVLQTYALDRTRNAIRALMQLRPSQATILRSGQPITLPIEQVQVGETMIIKPGDRIALDGRVVTGDSAVDQAAITGESMPVHKRVGDDLFAGSINQNGHLEAAVTRPAQDSTIARLIQMVSEAQDEKAETQRFIDKAEQVYAIGVIVVTLLAIAIPTLFLGEAFSPAFYRAMTIMVAASPCAIVISTPATVLSAIGNGARRGILFKGGVYVENAATIKVIAFDKTGTLTIGKPQVTDTVVVDERLTSNDLLRLAAAVETKSEHPLAQATVQAATAPLPEATQFQATPGQGVRAWVDDSWIYIGNTRFFADKAVEGWETAVSHLTTLQQNGKTSVLVVRQRAAAWQALGVLAYADVVRPEAVQIVQQLKARGIEKVVMLTGDHKAVAQNIATQLGIDDVYADLLPENKVAAIRTIQQQDGPVAMVGDGVNDAPALATADIGIAMGAAGTDVALETADIVLMSDKLENIPTIIGLSKATRRTLIANLAFALFMIGVMIVSIFVVSLPLPAAVVGHEGGTVLVSLNGLRMLVYKDEG